MPNNQHTHLNYSHSRAQIGPRYLYFSYQKIYVLPIFFYPFSIDPINKIKLKHIEQQRQPFGSILFNKKLKNFTKYLQPPYLFPSFSKSTVQKLANSLFPRL